MKIKGIYKELILSVMLVLCIVFLLPAQAFGIENKETVKLELTEEEQAFVDQEQEIVIGCPVNNCPVYYQDEKTGAIKGITIDILEEVAEITGLKFRYEALSSGGVTYEDLVRLQVDLVAGVEYNSVNEEAVGIEITNPYFQAQKVFVCRSDAEFDPEGDMTIAVISGSQTIERVIRKNYPNFKVVFYDNLEQALSDVLKGGADAVLQNQYCMERILARPQYEKLQVVATAVVGDAHCLGALVPVSAERENMIDASTACLMSVINKGIAKLDKDQVALIIIKETSANTYKLTLGDIVFRYRYWMVLMGLSVSLIMFLLYRNRKLVKKHKEQAEAERRAKELERMNNRLNEQQLMLKEALAKAEQAGLAKSRFLSNMSHDIRTPMNAIIGFTAIAEDHIDERERLQDCLGKISAASNYLLALINDVLDMSRIESGKIQLQIAEGNLSKNLGDLMDLIQPQAAAKNIEISVYKDITDEAVYVDSLRLHQILMNIMSNSVKFTAPGGKISLRILQSPSDAAGYADYTFKVTDNGIGISKEFLPHIFEAFEREKNTTLSKTEGTGLGLAIVKNIVTMMNGTISIESEVGKGTETTIILPIKTRAASQETILPESQAAASQCITADALKGKRLLLVEDNELNREIATELLQDRGVVIEAVSDGAQAVDKVALSEPGYYDAVLMDIQMPVMNGYEATENIRRLSDPRLARVPIIAMTANAFEEDRQMAFEKGMNAHIAKPLDIQKLLEALKKILM